MILASQKKTDTVIFQVPEVDPGKQCFFPGQRKILAPGIDPAGRSRCRRWILTRERSWMAMFLVPEVDPTGWD